MRQILFIVFLLFSIQFLFAQNLKTSYNESNELFGFKNDIGEMVIDEIYENTLGFYGGMALVKKNGKWGVIDKENKAVIKFNYSDDQVNSELIYHEKLADWIQGYNARPKNYALKSYTKEVYEKNKDNPINMYLTMGAKDVTDVILKFGYWVYSEVEEEGSSIVKDYMGNVGVLTSTLDADKKIIKKVIVPVEFLNVFLSYKGDQKFFNCKKIEYTYKNLKTGKTQVFLNANVPSDKTTWEYVSRKDIDLKYSMDGRLLD